MRLLLDTHTLLWFLLNDPKLSTLAAKTLRDPSNDCFVSPVSLLEIALKVRLGKLTLTLPFQTLFPDQLKHNDIEMLPCEPRHIAPLTTLPLHHRDPFDRLLAATSLIEGLILVSADAMFDRYACARLW